MKTIIAALALVLLAAGPTFAASPSAWQLHEGRASTFVPSPAACPTSRESQIRAF
jgi:hypothetical protein